MINKEYFASLCRENGIDITDAKVSLLDSFAEYLMAENEKYNLTAIKSPEAIMLRHFIDSMTVSEYINSGDRLLDIGSGAGFPAIPIAILRPDVNVTALDATAKKAAFINSAAQRLGLDNIKAVSGRAEELAHDSEMRGKYDVVTARAVSVMRIIVEIGGAFVSVGGRLAAMKGEYDVTDAELADTKQIIHEMGFETEKTVPLTLRDSSTGESLSRTIVILEKRSPTAAKYPRRYSVIVKK